MKTLIIARHGNTFRPGETPTRVGARTDLDLVEEGRGRGIGLYLKKLGYCPNRILAAPLQRTLKTAALAAEELGHPCPVQADARFLEIDYGPDENQTEETVKARLGAEDCAARGVDPATLSTAELDARGAALIDRWNTEAVAPPGWQVDVAAIRANWKALAGEIQEGETLLCVSSNGTIRFAPCITEDEAAFQATHDIKVPTGGVCIFTCADGRTWQCQEWGVKAFKHI